MGETPPRRAAGKGRYESSAEAGVIPQAGAAEKLRDLPHYIEDSLWVLGRNPKKHLRRALGLPPPLFPVLQGPHADPEECRKFHLREAILFADRRNVRLLYDERASRILLLPENRSPFAHAGDEFVKEFVVHGYSTSSSYQVSGVGLGNKPELQKSIGLSVQKLLDLFGE